MTRHICPSYRQRFRQSGFEHGDAGRHLGLGTANENIAYAGGAYIGLIYEEPPGGSGLVWFEETPRILGLVFSSTLGDAERWSDVEGAWKQEIESGDALRAGEVEFRFKAGTKHPIDVSASFAVPRGAGTIALSRGVIELVAG